MEEGRWLSPDCAMQAVVTGRDPGCDLPDTGEGLPQALTKQRRPRTGSQVAERLGNPASNLKVASSIPGRAK